MRNRRPVFSFTTEQTSAPGVPEMIQVYAAEYRRAKHNLEELRMKVSELSGKVDTLISLATNFKNASQSQQAAQLPQDDPEVEALAHRIDDAIAVLQGSATAAPVTADPGQPAAAPVAQDPNAPVV